MFFFRYDRMNDRFSNAPVSFFVFLDVSVSTSKVTTVTGDTVLPRVLTSLKQ